MNRGEGAFGEYPHGFSLPGYTAFPHIFEEGRRHGGESPFVTREPHETHWSDIMIEIITEADYKDRLAATQNGVLLFFKKLCPHCKNMEKVLEKFGAAKPGIALYGIDIEENAAAAAALGAERPPTIFVIKGGEVKASKVGLMNPREMAAFFEKALVAEWGEGGFENGALMRAPPSLHIVFFSCTSVTMKASIIACFCQ